jgi:hypothetical protein
VARCQLDVVDAHIDLKQKLAVRRLNVFGTKVQDISQRNAGNVERDDKNQQKRLHPHFTSPPSPPLSAKQKSTDVLFIDFVNK